MLTVSRHDETVGYSVEVYYKYTGHLHAQISVSDESAMNKEMADFERLGYRTKGIISYTARFVVDYADK